MRHIDLLNIKLNQIRIFLTVVEFGGFTAAAEQLNMTQPMISKTIAHLEQELGLYLILRGSRKFQVTPAGANLYEEWKHLIQSFENSVLNAHSIQEGKTETLKIGTGELDPKDSPVVKKIRIMKSLLPGTDVLNQAQPVEDAHNIQILKSFGGTRIGRYAMRSSATFLSPDMFDEFVWPVLKASIQRFWDAGIRCVLHCDAEWLPLLNRFLELPKTSVSFEFDGVTDIVKAYEIIGGWHSLRGDVPATMFAYGTPDDVREYCANLIDKLGTKGGFILGSGCEVPLNAKTECVKAMMEATS